MKSKRVILTVATSCNKEWNEMTIAEQGKYCSACEKNVLDFTGKTDSEIIAIIKGSKSNICGRFLASQLNREINYYENDRGSNLKYAAALALGLIVSQPSVAADNKPKTEMIVVKDVSDSISKKTGPKEDTDKTSPQSNESNKFVVGGLFVEHIPIHIDSTALRPLHKKNTSKKKNKN